ncbi:MAG: hypothetical protein H7Y30_01760 [Pyrinomonadaceae bacterium]|nr:hypothetical protein [Pyrinomonadaceae bacterium]
MSKSPTDVTNMMTEMNRGGVFYAEAMSQNLPKGRDQSGMEWVLSVNYRPPAGAPAGGAERPATVASAASAEGGER